MATLEHGDGPYPPLKLLSRGAWPSRSYRGAPCSIARALDVVGEKWALLAIREISFGNRRFNEIARNTGAPRDRLAARLHSLVEAGILERREYQDARRRGPSTT